MGTSHTMGSQNPVDATDQRKAAEFSLEQSHNDSHTNELQSSYDEKTNMMQNLKDQERIKNLTNLVLGYVMWKKAKKDNLITEQYRRLWRAKLM